MIESRGVPGEIECHWILLIISQHIHRLSLGALKHYLGQSPRAKSQYGVTSLEWIKHTERRLVPGCSEMADIR